MATPEEERMFADMLRQLSSGQRTEDPDDPPVWEFNANYRPDPNRGIYEPMKTQDNQYKKVPLSKATLKFYEMDRDELKRFQELAFQAGYYGSAAEREDIPFGSYDEDTFKVWATLAKRAANIATTGKRNTIWDVLQDDVNNRPAGLGKKQKKERAPLVTRLPDPREIEETIRDIAPDVIGRDPDDAFIQDFISMYQQMQARYQEQVYALEGTEEGGTVTAPPSAGAIARFRLRHERPEEFEEKRAASRHMQYLQLLKGAM